ncbi:telomere-associated protein RIF1 isoform X2 [Halichoeres trimaculatus]|uniref:telomere-associated protein RIF1 isoform X2 n=1 Tax=Halichoeres trimaculatus TaxID=147232 RepID=UPI003D9FB120
MMATAGPPSSSSFLPLLESVEDSATGQSEQTDAYLTIANRLSGEEGRQFLPAVEKHFSRFGKATLAHITSPNPELSQAALQALGFCVYHSHVVSGAPETLAAEILTVLCSLVVKATDKNTCTRALWVISKQSFPPDVVAKKVPSILGTLEGVWSREDIQSVVMEHEALNVVIRMLEQVPTQMGDGVVRWAKLIIPLVVHSASKVRLRAAAAMEMGMPLLLQKQAEVAAIIEPMMSSKLIPELQKLFMSKNETNVLKLWPLFVKLLGKLLHRGGPFINSLLHLEELGFRSSSPTIKKIAFIAWKSLIDNFALNPDILCSSKRMKLLMQPLASIHVRTEALLLTKVEVWWYLVVQLGPNLSANFDQVSVPLLQCVMGSDSAAVPGTPSRSVSQNGSVPPGTPKTVGTSSFNSPANSSRLSLNSSVQYPSTFPSVQLLGLEMLMHYFLGPDVIATAAKNKIILSLEPLNHPLLTGASSFTKHAAVLTSSIIDGFINIGKEAPDSLLVVLWTNLVRFVSCTIESVGSKKDRQGCEVLTLMLQALQSIVSSEALPADKVLTLFEATVKGIPQRVLGSASYQVGKMDVLNGTPALFLIQLLYSSSTLPAYIEDERFFHCLQTLVGCGLSGHTSPLAFGEAVLGAIRCSAATLQNKEQLWRMWSVMVSPLIETITQSNEVNQGDALEHNFSAMHSALMFPVTHLLPGSPLQQASQKSMLYTWSKLYKVFARCSALVVTAEENICCEELCAKITAAINGDALNVPSSLNAVSSILQVMMECVDFSPFTPQFQQKLKSPHTPVNWMKKRCKVLGNLTTFQSLLVQCLDVYLKDSEAPSEATGLALVSILSTLFSNLVLANTITAALTSLIHPLTLFYQQAASEPPRFTSQLQGKLEKLLSDVLGCLQTRSTLAYDSELLALLSPLLCVLFSHRTKQLRVAVAQFWNGTFGNSVSLTYPDEIRPILSQVKQKTPIILPGFEVLVVPDELSEHYSSESSQMETKLSGMPVSSVGKRDSLAGKMPEMKDRSSMKTFKLVSTKLDFGSPKPPHRGALEEEASIDFVFIPPEAKERVLTEHQKEVKRTKRVDIPAMYNNLDASLDTTVFSQYTQSQEDSLDKLPAEQTRGAHVKAPQTDAQVEEDAEGLMTAQDVVCTPAAETENQKQEAMIPDPTDVSMEDVSKSDDQEEETKQETSPNMSGSSDLVSGTPQKPNSRRQSFITLEKYAEGKPASPASVSKFTGPLTKISNSQEYSDTKTSQASRTSTSPDSQESQAGYVQTPESPVRPKDSGTKCEPVRLTDRLQSDTTEDEDVIPDTQTEAKAKESTKVDPTSQNNGPSSQDELSQTLDDSHSSESSPGEPRRSGRHRVRPLLPGEDPGERDQKFMQLKRKRSEGEPKGDSSKSTPAQSKPNTRSKNTPEEESRLRTRAQREKGESSQTNSQGRVQKKMRLYSSSQDFMDQPEPRRRSTRDRESSQTELKSDSQTESQSQGRGGRRSRSSLETKEDAGVKKKASGSSQTDSQSAQGGQLQGKISRQSRAALEMKEEAVNSIKDLPDKNTVRPEPEPPQNHQDQTTKDSAICPSTVKASKSQEADLEEKTVRDLQITPPPAAPQDFQDLTQPPPDYVKEDEARASTIDSLSQEESAAPPSDSQALRKSRRSKAASDSGQSQQSEGVETKKKEEDSQTTLNKPQVKDGTEEGADIKPSQEDSQGITPSLSDSQSVRKSRRGKALSDSHSDSQSLEFHCVKKSRKGKRGSQVDTSLLASKSEEEPSTAKELRNEAEGNEDKAKEGREDQLSKEASQKITPSSENQSVHKSRESKSPSDSQLDGQTVEITQKDPPMVSSSPAPDSQEETGSSQMLGKEPDAGDKTKEVSLDQLSQESSQVDTLSSSESQSLRRPRRSKASEAAEEKGQDKESSRRSSRSSSQVTQDAVEQVETRPGGRTRRSIVKEDQPKSRSESSQSSDGPVESTQGRGRYSRRSSQALVAESSGSESSEAKESPPVSKKRGRKAQAPLPSPLTLDSKGVDDSQDSQKEESQKVETQPLAQEPTEEPEQVARNTEEQQLQDSQMEVEEEETETTKTSKTLSASPQKDQQKAPETDETRHSKPAEEPEPAEITARQTQEETKTDSPCDSAPPAEAEHLQASEPPEDKATEPAEEGEKDQNQDSDSNKQEHIVVPEENLAGKIQDESPDQSECPDVPDDVLKEAEQLSADVTPLQESHTDTKTQLYVHQDVEVAQINSENDANMNPAPSDTCIMSALSEMARNLENTEKLPGSPVKQKDLEAVMGQDVGQSPSGGRTRGSWSPSASPSTSILKKGQKRALEDETPSPQVKSRRVSFANPIQHQETADDIDRRSPALRTSSPRRSKVSSIPQPKFITTPTKGMLILSPRNLHSPGYKSSKKCLISEMGQEPRPVSRDCIYPGLVGCSTPVEAVLPQISSNMWSRGFGQLVRARNIKTVGDLSALTPNEIKTLPIRSPKISNVKKALKIYEQQRKVRGGDELKSFDETEMMTSELDETNTPQNQDEEDKVSGEMLATELVDEPALPAEPKPGNDIFMYHTPEVSPGEQRAAAARQDSGAEGLLLDLEALSCRMTEQNELAQCSAQQLVQIHEQLGGMMRHVVVELQTRLCRTDGETMNG